MLKVWIATVLSFFFSGLGYVLVGDGTKRLLGLGWTAAALGLTYVEQSIQTAAPAYYWPMFATVLLLNACFAVDTYREGRARLRRGAELRGQVVPT
jgi:hypothetical protein